MTTAVSMYTYIDEFAKKPGNGKYPNIPRAEVVRGLKERMANPTKVDQAMASLCGPACLAFIILKHLPEMYAAYIMSLYETGSAKLGRMTIKPSDDCRNAKIFDKASNKYKIAPVDWVGLASLRDSENAVLDYDDPSDAFAGITMPGGLEGWFKDLKFSGVREKTNVWFDKGKENFREARHLFAQGYSVCLFVWGRVLMSHRAPTISTPDHWCVLNVTYPILEGDKVISMEVYTWGKSRVVTVTQEVFFRGYYGYVAGKWS